MSDDRPTRPNGPNEPTPRRDAEPEGGPAARQREFMEERFARLGEKGEQGAGGPEPTEETPPGAGPATRGPGAPPSPTGGAPLPSNFRRGKVREYRERQQEQAQEEAGEQQEPGRRGAASREAAVSPPTPPPPEAPGPPPSNNWIPIGPSILREGQGAVLPGTSGRTVGIAVAPGGTNVYIASANGGVWHSSDTGQTWRSLMDAFDLNPTTTASDSLSCGAIALVPGASPSSDRIYVGSGEGDGAAYFGVGPIVSLDGGVNWTTEDVALGSPQLAGSAFYALAVDPTNPDRVVAGTQQGVYRREPDGAGGFHWARKNPAGAASIWFPSVAVALSGGTPAFFAASWGGPVYSSTDGDAWATLGTGFPTADVGRVGLGVQAGNPSVVYALIARSSNSLVLGVWRYDAADNTWRQVAGAPSDLFGTGSVGQGWYDLTVAVDPNNVNRIYLGGSTKAEAGEWSAAIYRSVVSSSGTGASLTYNMANTSIGGSAHADVHTLVFAPGDSNKLWVGCDGGVFYSTNPTGSGNLFQSCNTGLATLTMNYLDQHPSQDAVIFSGTQDNGGVRYTGEEAWLHSVWGDSGYFVINWNDPYKVIATYTYGYVNRATDGGTRYNYTPVDVPLPSGEPVLFYAPLAGTPYHPAAPAEAERVAFGSNRVWISDSFGGGWQSIPSNTTSDQLGSGGDFRIRALAFASYRKLYAGTMNGQIHRYDQSGASWTRTRIDNAAGGALPLAGPVTDITVDPGDASGSSIYMTFGGSGDYRHLWHFNGTSWEQRSGPGATPGQQLLDIQHNAVVVDPADTSQLYLAADLGIWHSSDTGATWSPLSSGLPDAAVVDIKLHNPRRLLRAGTFGRGAYERTLDSAPKSGIELYIRDTQLDQGRFATVDGLPDPAHQGENVAHWRGPDIKVDTPDAMGRYQFPLTGSIDFFQFDETLSDDSQNVATHATATITTRVYVQVHNRGVVPADNVRVMLLLANASAGLPALPSGYDVNVRNGVPISSASWHTVGIFNLDDVRVGFPKIAAFDLTSDMLPPPANLAGNHHFCAVALVHHASDPYLSTETNTDQNTIDERKAGQKNLNVVQFVGTLPNAGPVVVPIRLNNARLKDKLVTTLEIDLGAFTGRARLYLPPLETDGDIKQLVEGGELARDFRDFRQWANSQVEQIKQSQAGSHRYHELWAKQRVQDLGLAAKSQLMLSGGRKPLRLRRIVMPPDSWHTVFLLLDRPADGKLGQSFTIEVRQLDDERQQLLGGLTTRVDLVPAPKEIGNLRVWTHSWRPGFEAIRGTLTGSDGRPLTPSDGVQVTLDLQGGPAAMRYHKRWRSFWALVQSLEPGSRIKATARVNGETVAESELTEP